MHFWLFSTNNRFLYKSLFSMVDCHGEKTTKHFDQCGSPDDKNTLYFGGLSQITDTITRFWSMNEMFWASNYILQTCNKVPANSCDICTHSLENVKTVSKNVPKQLRKTVHEYHPTEQRRVSELFWESILHFKSIPKLDIWINLKCASLICSYRTDRQTDRQIYRLIDR